MQLGVQLDVLPHALQVRHPPIGGPIAQVNFTFTNISQYTHDDVLIDLILTFVRSELFVIFIEGANKFVVAVDDIFSTGVGGWSDFLALSRTCH